MMLQGAHNTLKKHLFERYKQSCPTWDEASYSNLVCVRALMLLRLYLGIRRYMEEFPGFNLTSREAIIHMLHADADLPLNELDQIPASLALKLLDERLSSLDVSCAPGVQQIEIDMAQWLDENREWIAQSHEAGAGLPELQWSDLPDELFPGLKGN